LLTPYPARRELQVSYYFGDDAVFVFDHETPIAVLLEQFDIEWVLFTGYRADRRLMKQALTRRYLGDGRYSEPLPSPLGRPYGMDRESYTLGREYQAVSRLMRSLRASVFAATGTFVSEDVERVGSGQASYIVYRLPGPD
jgi:hypothetical protein